MFLLSDPRVDALLKSLKLLGRKLDEAHAGKLTEDDGILHLSKLTKEQIVQGKILETKGVLLGIMHEVKNLF